MRYASDLVMSSELENRSTAYMSWAIASDSRLTADRMDEFERRGWGHYSTFTKEVTDVLSSTDPGVTVSTLQTAFASQVDRATFFDKLDVATFPLSGVGRIQIGTASAVVVDEVELKPVGRLSFDLAGPPLKAASLLIASAEAFRAIDAATQQSLQRALVAAVAAAMDAKLVEQLTAGAAAPSSDVGALLAAISGGAPSRPFLVGGWDTLLPLAGTVADLRALGIGIVPSPAAAGQLIAIDADGMLFGDGGAEVGRSRHATVALNLGGSPATLVDVNLWQSGLECLKAERFFRLAFRPDAVAHASVGSPA